MLSKCYVVQFTKFSAKQMEKLPAQIREAVYLWKESVEYLGLPEVRQSKGYHDEPLSGRRSGQRSVRLNRAYRLIYEEHGRGETIVVGVQEVNKHEYRP